MAFMTPEIYEGRYAIVENRYGERTFTPAGYECVEEGETVEYVTGYLGRLSAAGYLDCTEWTPLTATDDDAAVRELCDEEDICHHCYEQCFLDDPCADAQQEEEN